MKEAAGDPKSNVAEFTVSEISGALKRTVEETYGRVRVRGEVSGYRGPHSSGHAYFSLKDDRSRLEAVIWRGVFSKLKFPPEEGMEVVATGKLTTYPGSSKYQIVIDNLEPAGAGALMALLEERRRKLAAEGLFDPARKQLLPFMPMVIGVVTSPTGAVIRDIIHRITDRFPLHVIVWPVRVQGETSGLEVANAVSGFNELAPEGPIARPDVLIVARGGGSLEDLWGFNDEAVVRAVAESDIPVISAVGHETDWTLIDHAADTRAPTPTGAAEMAVPVRAELEAQLANLSARLKGGISRLIDRRRQALHSAARALPTADGLLALPRRRFDEAAMRLGRGLQANTEKKRARFSGLRLSSAMLSQRIETGRGTLDTVSRRREQAMHAGLQRLSDRLSALRLSATALSGKVGAGRSGLTVLRQRLDQSIDRRLERYSVSIAQSGRLMHTLSHQSVLERGFALVRGESDLPLTRAAGIAKGTTLSIEFADGRLCAIASGNDAPPGVQKKKRQKTRPPTEKDAGQGSLF